MDGRSLFRRGVPQGCAVSPAIEVAAPEVQPFEQRLERGLVRPRTKKRRCVYQLTARSLERDAVSAEHIIQGHQQIITRARAMGLRVYGATLPPVEGFPFPGFWTPVMEEKRQVVNRFVRRSGAYEAG